MTYLGPNAVKAVFNAVEAAEAAKRNQRLADAVREMQEIDAAAERVLCGSDWDAERLRRYRAMGYSVRRLAELSGHSRHIVRVGIADTAVVFRRAK